MSELQALLTGWLTELAAVLPFGFAFGVGVVAAVNPCGFAMLPAYLSLYLGAREEDFGKSSSMSRLLRSLLVGATVSSGFVVLFGLAGLIISAGGTLLLDVMPALGIVIGGVLILQLVESEGVMTTEGPKIPTRYTHRQLATMIGSKRETVTKAFTLLQQAGTVELKRRRIHVKDAEALKRVANQGLHPIPVP